MLKVFKRQQELLEVSTNSQNRYFEENFELIFHEMNNSKLLRKEDYDVVAKRELKNRKYLLDYCTKIEPEVCKALQREVDLLLEDKKQIKNPDKFVGSRAPTFRSRWESAFMQFCDTHPSVVKWASESVKIPYKNPITGKNSNYIPDFLVQYQDKNGKVVTELVEIKPKNQSIIESKNQNRRLAETVAVNHAKWEQAMRWCKQNGLRFRVVTEEDIFRSGAR